MSKKITLTFEKESTPKYFKWSNRVIRVDKDTFIQISKHTSGYDIETNPMASFDYLYNQEVEPITKAEFVAHCNKAYKAITGFRHVEDLWVDEEGDAHE